MKNKSLRSARLQAIWNRLGILRRVASRQYRYVLALALVISAGLVGTAAATTTSSSAHYQVTETQFGAGSSLHDCSANYCAKTSAGDTVVGSASSNNYSAQLGFNTTDIPLLEVSVTGGTQNMGVLDNATTGTATNVIKVRNYLSKGYVLQITGAAPNQGTHTLRVPMGVGDSPFTSQPGAEQFGINFAANSTPHIGADPLQVPSGAFSFGTVVANYGTADFFKYKDGDVVAQSLSSTGETDYTMSMIINVSNVTPGGHYNGTFSAVAVPVY